MKAATYTWSNTNVNTTGSATLDWLTSGPNTQGTWTGGTPVSGNTNVIQFFSDTTTAFTNTAAVTQTSNINNGGTAFQLATLTLNGLASATANANLSMTISGDALNFSGATGTINLNALNSTRTITYNLNSNVQLGTASSASVLTIAGNGTGSFNIGGIISELNPGGGSLIKSGTSTVTLTGANSYTGTTIINAGSLTVSGVLGTINTSAGVSVASGATLNLDNSAGSVNRISDTAVLTLNGGTLVFTGNGATSSTTETFDTLAVGAGGATITLTGAGASQLQTISVASAFSRTGSGTALIRGTSLQTGNTNATRLLINGPSGTGLDLIGAGTAAVGTSTAGTTKTISIVPYLIGDTSASGNGSSFLTYDTTSGTGGGLRPLATGEYTTLTAGYTTPGTPENVKAFSGTITTANPTVNSLLFSTATQTLVGSGTLTVNSGAIAATTNTQIINGFTGITLGNGTWNEGILTATSGNTLTINAPITVSGGGGLTKAGAGTLTLGASNAYTGTTTVNGGTLILGTGTGGDLGSNTSGIVLNSSATLSFNRTNSGLSLSNNISGNGGVTQTGTGTTILAGNNTYSGVTTLSAGVLVLGNANALPGGTATTGGTGALSFNGGVLGLGSTDFTRSYSGITAGVIGQFAVLGNTGPWWAAYGADRVVNVGGAGATLSTFNGKPTNFGAADATNMLTYVNGISLTTANRPINVIRGITPGGIDARLSGVHAETANARVALSKTGNGTLALTGLSTFTGNVLVNSGIVIVNTLNNIGNNSPIGTGAGGSGFTLSGGTFQYAPVVGVGGASTSTDRNFAIISSSSLNASGTGAVVFNAPTGGIVSPDVSGAFNATGTDKNLTFSSLAALNNLTVGMTVTGSGIPTGATIAGINGTTNVVTLTATANVAAGTGVSASFGTPTNRNLTLTGTNTGANTIAGTLQDSSATGIGVLSLTKAGTGTWVLTGANTYTGATSVNTGNLTLGATNALPAASAVNLGGGTLAVANGTANGSSTGGVLTISASSVIDFGNAASATVLSFGDSSAATWAGALTINGYTGPGNSTASTTTQLFVGGPSSTPLTAGQLAAITFTGYGLGTATQLSTGEVVPVGVIPEPMTVGLIASVGFGLMGFIRRRRSPRHAPV